MSVRGRRERRVSTAAVKAPVAWCVHSGRRRHTILLRAIRGCAAGGPKQNGGLRGLQLMASSSNQNGGEAFKVAVESIIQRPIKEINYEGEETYEE